MLLILRSPGKPDGHRVVDDRDADGSRPGKQLQLQGVATGAATDALPVETAS
jgi:hypothetical protein